MPMENRLERDWMFSGEGYLCDVRTVGVLVQQGRLLVQRERDGAEYALPGGHIKVGETTADGLLREFREEMGADVQIQRLLWTEECFWQWKGKAAHNLAFYYLIRPWGRFPLPMDGEFRSQKDNSNVLLGWMPLDRLGEVVLYPEFAKAHIHDLSAPPKHFITRA